MEYALNVLQDYLPVERTLMIPSHVGTTSYGAIAVAMCDGFRQETVVTGHETWSAMNDVAASCIERCIRICKFRMLRVKVCAVSSCSEMYQEDMNSEAQRTNP